MKGSTLCCVCIKVDTARHSFTDATAAAAATATSRRLLCVLDKSAMNRSMLADTSNSNLSYIPNGSTDDVVYRPEPTWPLLKQPAFMVAILSTAYFLVLVMGVINNSLIVAVIYRNPQLRTVTNYFLANLAIADILVSVLVLPITLLSNLFNGEPTQLLTPRYKLRYPVVV